MYKNIAVYFLAIAVIFAGCTKKVEDVFDKSPDQRLAEALAGYQKTLTSAPNGWKVFIIPKGLEKEGITVGGFSFYMKFTDSNRVTMLSDFDTTKAATFKESGYRLTAVQRPSIYFDTYSYIHIPADPTFSISKGPSNADNAWGTDFDFAITDIAASDTIHLKGNYNGSAAYMVKATKQEADAYNSKQLANSIKQLQNLNAIGYFKVLNFGGKQYYINIDEGNRRITFSWLDASGKVQSYTTGYYSTLTGIFFTVPFNTGTAVIPGIDFTSFVLATATMNVSINGTASTITNAGAPLQLDVAAAQRWWQYAVDRGSYWISPRGFHVNGADDGFNWSSVAGYQFLLFWPKYGTSGGVTYDLLSPIVNNTISYGAAYRPPTFTADGRIIFTYFGTLGTVPAAVNTMFVNMRIQMADPNGYYLIQTGALTYDMVSKDGKTWVTWQW